MPEILQQQAVRGGHPLLQLAHRSLAVADSWHVAARRLAEGSDRTALLLLLSHCRASVQHIPVLAARMPVLKKPLSICILQPGIRIEGIQRACSL